MKYVPKSVTRNVGKAILKSKKNSPHIFFAAGVVGVVGGTVLACRATLKAGETIDKIQEDVENLKDEAAPRLVDLQDDYIQSDYQIDMAKVYGQGAIELARLYAPAIVVTGISITALTGSHIQLTRRNTALTATLTSVSAAYEKYRAAVREKLGVEEERDVFQGARTEAVTHADGTKEVVKVSEGAMSPYAVCFDEFNVNWERNAEYNKMFLEAQQTYLNHKLQARGHVFLNEVYEGLGFDHTTAGAVVGWVWGGDGDDYIDFGLYEAHNEDFITGQEQSIWLDFNVDGVVYDLIDKKP